MNERMNERIKESINQSVSQSPSYSETHKREVDVWSGRWAKVNLRHLCRPIFSMLFHWQRIQQLDWLQ